MKRKHASLDDLDVCEFEGSFCDRQPDSDQVKHCAATTETLAPSDQRTLDAFLNLKQKPVLRRGPIVFGGNDMACSSCQLIGDHYEIQCCALCAQTVCSFCSVRLNQTQCLHC